MGKIAEYKNLRFYFYSEDRAEPKHIHISIANDYGRSAKVWLEPEIRVEKYGVLSEIEMKLA